MHRRIATVLALAALVAGGAVVAQEAFKGPGLGKARDAMADRNYPEAARLLSDFLEKNPDGGQAEDPGKAEVDCQRLGHHVGTGRGR